MRYSVYFLGLSCMTFAFVPFVIVSAQWMVWLVGLGLLALSATFRLSND